MFSFLFNAIDDFHPAETFNCRFVDTSIDEQVHLLHPEINSNGFKEEILLWFTVRFEQVDLR